MAPLTPEKIADAFRASMPQMRSEFATRLRDFGLRMTYERVPEESNKYLILLVELLEKETNARMALAEKFVCSLLDSGWPPTGANAIQAVLTSLFSGYHDNKNPTTDLTEAAKYVNAVLKYPSPYEGCTPGLALGHIQVAAFNAAVARLEVHVVPERLQPGNVFHGPTQYVAGDGNTVSFTNIGNFDARSIHGAMQVVRDHLDEFAPDDREDAKSQLSIVESELQKPEPNTRHLRAAWRALQKMLGAGASAALSAAVEGTVRALMPPTG